MHKALKAAILLTIFAIAPVRADVMLLVHGYLGGAHSWDSSGITTILQQRGWQRGGVFLARPAGLRLVPAGGMQAERKFYAVDLASLAPLRVQIAQLQGILHVLQQTHRDEPVIIVGHSAGGVVARAVLVLGGGANVTSLITIASPHLGTIRAEQALDATDIPFPFSVLADFFAGDTYDIARSSRALYLDLVRPYPGSFLHWLNSRPHPDIRYVSVIRDQTGSGGGDYVVPSYSQDMNNVAALRGRSARLTIALQHALTPADGRLIMDTLSGTRAGAGK
jgi:pimeloyl-ACP methyl ester carboxylesterase